MTKILKLIIILKVLTIYSEVFCSISEFDIGIAYFIDGRYDLAEYMFRKSYLLKENSQQAKLFLANTCYINKKYKEAKNLYYELLEDRELPEDGHNFVKFMYAECCVFLGEYDTAIKMYNNIDINNEPLLAPYIFYGKIFSLYKIGEYNQVLSNISVLKSYIKSNNIKLNDKLIEQVDYLLAETWFSKGDYKNAAASFNSFISRYKNSHLSVYANIRLATIYDEQRKYNLSETVLKSIDFNNVDSSDIEIIVKYNLGKILTKQNKFSQAIKIYHQLIEKLVETEHEILPYLYLELAYCYYRTKDYDKTIAILTSNKIEDPKLLVNYDYLLSLAYYNKGNYGDAIKMLSRILKLYPNNKWSNDIVYWLGLAYFRQGEYKRAIQTLALFEKNKSSIYYLPAQIYIAKSYRELKEYELAKIKFTKLLENKNIVDSNTKSILLFELGECYKLTGDYQSAIHYYTQTISTTNDINMKILTKIALAEVYNYLGEYVNSERIIEEIINTKNLNQELFIKSRLVYITTKYYKGDFKATEQIALDLLKKDKFTDNQEKRFILSLLVNIYTKTGEVEKLISYADKLIDLTEDLNTKFVLQTKILRILDKKNMLQEMFTRVNELKKQYKTSNYQCLLNYYLLKYYYKTNQQDLTNSLISTMGKFVAGDYKLFTSSDLLNFIDICMKYNTNFVTDFTISIILTLDNLDNQEKFNIAKKVVEELIQQQKYNSVLKLAASLKKISTDTNTISYTEFIIGRVYELTNKAKLAESIYNSIIEKYPESEYLPQVYLALIKYYTAENKLELAQLYEEKFVNKYKDTTYVNEYIYNKSLTLMNNGEYDKAIKNLLTILDTKDKNISSRAQKLLADCYYKMGRYKEAVVEYLRVIYLYPDMTDLCAESQYMVGVCTEKLNLYDEAKKAYRHSIIKYPGTLWAQEAELKLKRLR